MLPSDITVVIPWGKIEGNVERCLRSVLVQSHLPVEVLLIVNGPVNINDAHGLVQSLCNPIIRCLTMPACANANQARNFGARQARSTWIAFLDSDDWWDPEHLATSLNLALNCNADLVYSGMRMFLKENRVIEREAADYRIFGGIENYLISSSPAQTSSYLVRRSTILAHKWNPRLRRHQDFELIARLARYANVMHRGGITVNVDWTDIPRRHKAHSDCFLVLSKFKPYLRRELYRRHFINLFHSARGSCDVTWWRHVLEYEMLISRMRLSAFVARLIRLFASTPTSSSID